MLKFSPNDRIDSFELGLFQHIYDQLIMEILLCYLKLSKLVYSHHYFRSWCSGNGVNSINRYPITLTLALLLHSLLVDLQPPLRNTLINYLISSSIVQQVSLCCLQYKALRYKRRELSTVKKTKCLYLLLQKLSHKRGLHKSDRQIKTGEYRKMNCTVVFKYYEHIIRGHKVFSVSRYCLLMVVQLDIC